MKIILYFLAVATVFIIFQFYLFRALKELRQPQPDSYEDIMAVLTETIKKELEFTYRLDYSLKNIATETKIMPIFKEELSRITGRIFHSLSPIFVKEFERYHNKEYLILFISKNVEMFLIEYINKNKIKTK